MDCTSRDNLRTALSHREPSRIVVDFGATTSTGIAAMAYNRLKAHLGMNSGHTRVFDPVQQLAVVEDPVLDRYGIDVVAIGRAYDEQWYDVTLSDGSPARWPVSFRPERRPGGELEVVSGDGTAIGRMPAHGAFFDQCFFPYASGYPPDFRDLDRAMQQVLWGACPRGPWQHKAEPEFWPRLRELGLRMRESGRAVVITVGCNLIEWGMFLRRMDNFLMDLYAEPAQAKALFDALLERHMATLERAVEAVGDIADVFRFGDDLGMQQGPFLSPEVYRALLKPRHKQLCDYVKRHTQAFTLLHSCGSIADLIPDLIDAGFDAINPVQTTCRGMDPTRLKRDFGRDIAFWGGGCDTRAVLNRCRPEEVTDHVRRRLDVLAPGGGFVFATIHNILPEVPPENIDAMFRAVREYA